MRGLVVLLSFFVAMDVAVAEVPQQLHYNGYLTNAVGEAVDCPDPVQCANQVDVTFRIYPSSEGGAPLWEEIYPGMPVFSGSFHVILGTINPVSADLLDGPTWLSVKVNDNAEMSPRQKIVAAAYALRAGTSEQAIEAVNATQLGGVDASEYTPQAILAPVATQGLSDDLADGDDDTLGTMPCGIGMVAKATGAGGWVCGNDEAGGDDTTLSEAQVDEMVADNGYAANADLVAAQTALTELQALVTALEVSSGSDLSALQAQVTTLESALANAEANLVTESTTRQTADDAEATARAAKDVELEAALATETTIRTDGDLVLQGNINAVQATVVTLQDSLASVATSGSFSDLSDVPTDADTLASLGCAEGEVPQWDGAAWACGSGLNGVGVVEPKPCDTTSVGSMYFDTVTNALRICDGVSYRKVKLCSELCPSAETVACGAPISDDCGGACEGTGTALNTVQCQAPGSVSCGTAILDNCGNPCVNVGNVCAGGGICSEGSCLTLDSCATIDAAGLSTGDGEYVIDMDGVGAFTAYCDMSSPGGPFTHAVSGGLVAYWSFDGGTPQNSDIGGVTASFTGGAGATGPGAAGLLGNSASFNNEDSQRLDLDGSLPFSAQSTVLFWGNNTSCSNNQIPILFVDSGTRIGDLYYESSVQVRSNSVFFKSGPGCGTYQNSWHHRALRDNGSAIQVWLDGNEISSDSPHTYHSFDGEGLNRFGSRPGFGTNGLGGYLDEVVIFNRALTEAEIQRVRTLNLAGKAFIWK